jgi:hypothetical protein
MIANDKELLEKVREASTLLQDIADYTKGHPKKQAKARVRFPRGFITTASHFRASLPFIEDDTLKRNVSYALMSHDALRWLTFHTDIAGQAQEMLIKEGVCLVGSICESISIFPDEHGLGRGSSFAKRVARLAVQGVINEETRDRLCWLWDKRNQEHIYDVPFREFSHYQLSDWREAVKAYKELRDGLRAWRCPEQAAAQVA